MNAVSGAALHANLSRSQAQALKTLISKGLNRKINLGFNGVAAGINLVTTIAGNIAPGNSIQEHLEKGSSFISKCATVVQGLLNADTAIGKKNIIATIGGLLELPIAIFVKGFNLFLARGISAGLNHFDSIIIRTKKRDKDGKIIKIAEEEQYYDDFKKEGWVEGFKITCKNIPRLIKELYPNPFKESELFPRSFFICSAFMIIGSSVAFSGLTKLGATIRHVFGGLAGVALATDKITNTNLKSASQTKGAKETTKQKGISRYAMSGIIWILAAIPDVLKHFDFFSSKINNWTELALCLDRLASIFYTDGNTRKGEN